MSSPIVIGLLYGLLVTNTVTPTIENSEVITLEEFKETVDTYVQEREEVIEESFKEIMLTSYWNGDSTGSNSCTGSGKCESDFKINHNGWYTYNGHVVIATATNLCLELTTGVCSQYSQLPDGYEIYNYGDTLEFQHDGAYYTGIVLDTCGASFWKEDYQRFDIFVSSPSHSIGKVKGLLK